MTKYSKKEAIKIVTSAAKKYQNELVGKVLLFLYVDGHGRCGHLEASFSQNNFLHLTGFDTQLSPAEFFSRCIKNKLSANDFNFDKNGTTQLKLNVLPNIIAKDLSAKMIGDLDAQTIKLYTEKLIGNVTACMGFIQCGKTYKPNTVLESNLKNYSKAPCRVIATFRKAQQEKTYIVYRAKGIKWANISLPEEIAYLSSILSSINT